MYHVRKFSVSTPLLKQWERLLLLLQKLFQIISHIIFYTCRSKLYHTFHQKLSVIPCDHIHDFEQTSIYLVVIYFRVFNYLMTHSDFISEQTSRGTRLSGVFSCSFATPVGAHILPVTLTEMDLVTGFILKSFTLTVDCFLMLSVLRPHCTVQCWAVFPFLQNVLLSVCCGTVCCRNHGSIFWWPCCQPAGCDSEHEREKQDCLMFLCELYLVQSRMLYNTFVSFFLLFVLFL